MEDNKTLELRLCDLWSVFKRCWILMIALAVAAGGIVYAVSAHSHHPKYTSTATLYVRRETGSTVTASDISIATTLIKDFIELNINDSIVEQAREATQTAIPAGTLKQMVSLTFTEGTRVMYVTVTADDAATAQQLANAFADAACAEFNSLFDVTKEDGTVLSQKMLAVHSYGALNSNVSNPLSLTPVWSTAAVAAVLVYIVFLVLYLTNGSLRTADDVQKHLQLDVLCDLADKKKPTDKAISALASRLLLEEELRSIAIIGGIGKSGSTDIVPMLASALTERQKKVCLGTAAQKDADTDYTLVGLSVQENLLDTALIAKDCDGVIFVLCKGAVSCRAARSAKELLEKSGCKLLGVVLDRRKEK